MLKCLLFHSTLLLVWISSLIGRNILISNFRLGNWVKEKKVQKNLGASASQSNPEGRFDIQHLQYLQKESVYIYIYVNMYIYIGHKTNTTENATESVESFKAAIFYTP